MDGLSLLCNLHADGPLTLRRLRAAGVRELGALEHASETVLGDCLRSTPAHARRFVEEGRQLALRLAESPLELEPAFIANVVPGPTYARPTYPRLDASSPQYGLHARHPLAPGLFEGLDARTCERLAARGVDSLETLHERASLELARAAGIPFAKLLDLAAQARLVLSPRSAAQRPHEVRPEAPRRAPALAGRSIASPAAPFARTGRVHASEPGPAGPFG